MKMSHYTESHSSSVYTLNPLKPIQICGSIVGVRGGGEPLRLMFSPPEGWRVHSPLMRPSVRPSVCLSVTTERLSKL